MRSWSDVDEAFFDVTEGIRKVVVQLGTKPVSHPEVLLSQASKGESAAVSPTVLTPPPATPLPSLKPEAVSLLNTFFGHTFAVLRVAFSPDGQILASSSWDETIKIWGEK